MVSRKLIELGIQREKIFQTITKFVFVLEFCRRQNYKSLQITIRARTSNTYNFLAQN